MKEGHRLYYSSMTQRRNKDKEIEELKARNTYLENKNRIFSNIGNLSQRKKTILVLIWVFSIIVLALVFILSIRIPWIQEKTMRELSPAWTEGSGRFQKAPKRAWNPSSPPQRERGRQSRRETGSLSLSPSHQKMSTPSPSPIKMEGSFPYSEERSCTWSTPRQYMEGEGPLPFFMERRR